MFILVMKAYLTPEETLSSHQPNQNLGLLPHKRKRAPNLLLNKTRRKVTLILYHSITHLPSVKIFHQNKIPPSILGLINTSFRLTLEFLQLKKLNLTQNYYKKINNSLKSAILTLKINSTMMPTQFLIILSHRIWLFKK